MVITHCVFEVSGIMYKRGVRLISGLFINIHLLASNDIFQVEAHLKQELRAACIWDLSWSDLLVAMSLESSAKSLQLCFTRSGKSLMKMTNNSGPIGPEDIGPIRGRNCKYNLLPSVREKGHYPLDQVR